MCLARGRPRQQPGSSFKEKEAAHGSENQQPPPASCLPQLPQRHRRSRRAHPAHTPRANSTPTDQGCPTEPGTQQASSKRASTPSSTQPGTTQGNDGISSHQHPISDRLGRPPARTHTSRSLQHPQRQPPAAAAAAAAASSAPPLPGCPPLLLRCPDLPRPFFPCLDWTRTGQPEAQNRSVIPPSLFLAVCHPPIHPSLTARRTHTTPPSLTLTLPTLATDGRGSEALDAVPPPPCRLSLPLPPPPPLGPRSSQHIDADCNLLGCELPTLPGWSFPSRRGRTHPKSPRHAHHPASPITPIPSITTQTAGGRSSRRLVSSRR